MSHDNALEDLLVRARREKLDDGEEKRFEAAVQSSRELELLYEAGTEFDEQAGLLPGDEARMSALVERTLARIDTTNGKQAALVARGALPDSSSPERRRTSRARNFGISVASGTLLSVAVASAWQYADQRRWFGSSAELSKRFDKDASRRGERDDAASSSARAPSLDLATPTARSASARPALAEPRKADTKAMRSVPNASALFSRASEARRGGDIEAAIVLYERLCVQFPSSIEAEDSRVILGNLRLSQRSPRAALQQFKGYGSGPLSLEALWGEAQALRKLESADEQEVLEQLIRDYPASPYSGAARKRIEQLSR